MAEEVQSAEIHPAGASPNTSAYTDDQSHSEGLQLEREKFEFLQKMQTAELDLKKAESLRSRWTNPFIVAIIGALLEPVINFIPLFALG